MVRDIFRQCLKILGVACNFPSLKLHHVKLGKGCGFRGLVYIKTSRACPSIFIGANCNINSSLRSDPIGGSTRSILYTRGEGTIIIGDRVGISNTAIVATQSVTIGNDTNIGGGTVIYDTDFHSLNADDRLAGDRKVRSAPVKIGEKVFIGGHCIILKGAEIGDNAVIGAGSVVAGKILANEIWAGNPARKIKDNI